MQTFLPAEDLSQFGIDHGYGLGLERYAMDGMTVIGHMGTGNTGSSYVGYDAEHGNAVAVTTNTAIAGPAAIIAVEALTAIAPDEPSVGVQSTATATAIVPAEEGFAVAGRLRRAAGGG